MVEKEVPLALQDVLNGGAGDHVVITLVPLVSVLPHIRCVVAGIQAPHVVHHRKQGVPVVDVGGVRSDAIVVVVIVASVRHEGSHVQVLREGDESGDLFM